MSAFSLFFIRESIETLKRIRKGVCPVILSVSSSSESQLKPQGRPRGEPYLAELSVSSSSESQLKLNLRSPSGPVAFAAFSLFFIRESIETSVPPTALNFTESFQSLLHQRVN